MITYINLTAKKIKINDTILEPASLVPSVKNKVIEHIIDGEVKIVQTVWSDIIGLPTDLSPSRISVVDADVAKVAKKQNVASIKTSTVVDDVVVVSELEIF